MGVDLRAELDRLAEQAGTPAPPPDLWQRGRRRARSRRAGTAIVLALAVLVVVALVGVAQHTQGSAAVPAAGGARQAHLPDRFYTPSPWLSGTAEEGPPGRLVAVIRAQRNTLFGHHPGLVGVSATDGSYRFLDLPGLDLTGGASNADFGLSPDGELVAYWSRAPEDAPRAAPEGPNGLRVYDTRTGRVARLPLHATTKVEPTALFWVAEHTLVAGYDELSEPGPRESVQGLIWRPDSKSATQRLPAGFAEAMHLDLAGPAGRGRVGILAGRHDRNVRILDPAHPGHVQRLRLSEQPQYFPTFNADGSRLAMAHGGVRSEPVSVGTAHPGGTTVLAPVRHAPPTLTTGNAVAGWLDDHHVAVLTPRAMSFALVSVDTRTGHSRTLSATSSVMGHVLLARGLVDAPPASTAPPPTPLGPRKEFGGIVAVIVLAGLVLWARRQYGDL